jgi:hypothetical protein
MMKVIFKHFVCGMHQIVIATFIVMEFPLKSHLYNRICVLMFS